MKEIMKLDNNCKRLTLFFMYDKDGIIDDYVVYLLKQMKKVSTDIKVICNGKLCEDGREKLKLVVPQEDIIVRENKGYDVWAYKTGIDFYGWDRICEYDEIIMMNFTIMGPVYPIEEMFDKMNGEDIDFWGISKFTGYEEGDPFGTISYGYIPEHIQSHFIAVRKSMLQSKDFQKYWNNMPEVHDYREAVGFHEAIFTKQFADLGYKWDVYAKLEDAFSRNPVICASKELIRDARCPFFKRRSFMQDYGNVIDETIGQSTLELYEYIRDYTDYDVNYIWDNIFRLENQAIIKRNMHFNYILPRGFSEDATEILKKRKIALVMHIYYEDQAEVCLEYAKSMPPETDVYITTDSEEKLAHVKKVFEKLPCQNLTIQLRENKGRDLSTLIVSYRKEIAQYDYVCYMHDKKVKQLTPQTIGYGFAYKCFENILASRDFVNNVLHTFEKNERLGMMAPPPPNHGQYYFILGQEWGKNYEETVKLAEKLNLSVNIKKEYEPISAFGSMFWFRPKALKKLLDYEWTFDELPDEPVDDDGTILHAIERIHGFVCQDAGYYPAYLLSDRGASMELTNLEYMIKTLNKTMFANGCAAGSFYEVNRNLELSFSEFGMRGISDTKLYVDINNQGFMEQNTIKTRYNEEEDGFIYEFANTEQFKNESNFTAIRWDPGERGNVVIAKLRVVVKAKNGEEHVFYAKDTLCNAFKNKDVFFFFANDPQITILFKKAIDIEKVSVYADVIPSIDETSLQNITVMLNNRSLIKRIKNKLFG